MHVSKATKAIFILANYVTANLVPPHLKINVRLNQHAEGDGSVEDVDVVDDNTSVKPSLANVPEGLLPRQQSCDRYKEEKDQRKEEKDKRYQVKKKEERRKYKNQKYEVKKEKEKKKYQANEERKKDNERRKKVRRAGRCLPIVALAMGAGAASEFADEFFHEAYLESMDLEQFWPEDLPAEPSETEDDDKIFEDEKYIDKWVIVGNSGGVARRTGTGLGQDTAMNMTQVETEIKTRQPEVAQLVSSSDEAVNGELDARFLPFLIPIFGAVVGTAARVGVAAGRAAGAVLKLTRYTVKIGKGKGSKKSYKEQSEGARKISQNRNWRKCLTRSSPSA